MCQDPRLLQLNKDSSMINLANPISNAFKHYSLLFVFLLLLSACNNDVLPHQELELRILENIELDVPDSVNYNFEFWHISEIEGSHYLAGLIDNKIEVFDLKSNKYIKRIHLKWNGPNSVGRVTQFHFHTFDSVFLFSKSDYDIYLINSEGDRLKKYNVNQSLEYYSEALSIECFRNYGDRILYRPETKQILLRTYPPYDLVKDLKTYKVPYKIYYNIEDQSVVEFFGIYPVEFSKGNEYYSNDYQISYCQNCPRNILRFRRSHYLFEVDVSTNKINDKHYVKSNHIDKTFNLIPRDSDFERIRLHYTNEPSYVNILYNSTTKQYYRLVSHESNSKSFKPSSVIILDESLKPVGEIVLPPKYFIKSAQIFKNGMMVYRYNNLESKLTYDIISTEFKSN